MSAVLAAPSQLAPRTRYVVLPDASGHMFTVTDGALAGVTILPVNTVLEDMGKTITVGAYLMRKVKRVTDAGDAAYGVGYISLNTESVTVSSTAYSQGVVRLN